MPIDKGKKKRTTVPGIWQLAGGRFLVRMDWTDPRTGRRRSKQKVIATDLLSEAVAAKEGLAGDSPERELERPRWRDFAEQWLRSAIHRLRPATIERYTRTLAEIEAHFGRFYVDAIRPRDIRLWRDSLAPEYSPATLNAWLRVFRTALQTAVDDGLIDRNAARAVRALPEPKRTRGRRGRALTPEQLARLLDVSEEMAKEGQISPDVARMVATLAWTGLRKGELLALSWSDFRDGELEIRRAVSFGEFGPTKTDDPRIVPVHTELARVLEEQRRWLVETQHPGLASGLVFPATLSVAKAGANRRKSDTLRWFRARSVLDRPLRKICARADVPEVSPHSFRRTYENLLRKAGVEALTRRSLAGWRTSDAQEIYAGVDPEERKAAAGAMLRVVRDPSARPGPK